MYLRDGKLLNIWVPQVFDDIQFPPGFFADAEARQQYGVIEVPDPVWPDSTFYDAVQGEDGQLTVTERELAEVRLTLKARAAAARWHAETGGVTVGGIRVGTDKVDQAALTGAIVSYNIGAITEVQWKGSDGAFTTVPGQALVAISVAIAQHVQTCFSREADLCAQIDAAATLEALQLVDVTVGWPGSQ